MTRRPFPAKVMLAAFERAKERCQECTAPLRAGKIHYDHIIPDAMGGTPTLDNCQVLCTACHSVKTCEQDLPAIARAKRRAAKHHSIRKRSSFPGSRDSKWKRKVSGETVLR